MRQIKLFLLSPSSQIHLGYINGIQLVKFEIVMDRTSSSLYFDVRLNNLASLFCLSLISFKYISGMHFPG